MKIEKDDPVLNEAKPQDAKPQNAKQASARPNVSKSEESHAPAIAGLVIAVVLLAVGLWLARELMAASKMQDCVMSGRTNCNVIQPKLVLVFPPQRTPTSLGCALSTRCSSSARILDL